METWYVYILGNDKPTLYIGITNNLIRRIYEHKNKVLKGFTQKYNLFKLLYCEVFIDLQNAILREKQIKHWNRDWKLRIIKEQNPNLEDLYNNLIK